MITCSTLTLNPGLWQPVTLNPEPVTRNPNPNPSPDPNPNPNPNPKPHPNPSPDPNQVARLICSMLQRSALERASLEEVHRRTARTAAPPHRPSLRAPPRARRAEAPPKPRAC